MMYFSESNVAKTAIFCILGIVGAVILIVIVMFIVQRCIAMRKLKQAENTESAENNVHTESMLQNRTNKELSAIYRPSQDKKKSDKSQEEEGVLLTATSRPISQPPSYDEVLRQDSQLSDQEQCT